MARKTSPFAALTSEQKQMKWMEYQSIRLPYTNAEPFPANEEQRQPADKETQPADTRQNASKQPSPSQAVQPPPADCTAKRPIPPPEVCVQPRAAAIAARADQKTRHQQYDAVIARMKQAELRTGSYRSWSQ